jgi:predicted Zn finger-like uncharacterized protein
MPEQIRCPSCNAVLRVPDDLLGQQVKCPKCQETFTAALEPAAEPEGIVADLPTPTRRRPSRRPEADDEEYPQYEGDDLDADRPIRRRGRSLRRSEDAEAAVAAPAICLMVLGGLDIVIMVENLMMTVVAMGANGAGNNVPHMAGQVTGAIVGLIFAVVILMGGIRMKQLQSYQLAMTAAILALLPCGNCCIIGLPLGIWALVVLYRPGIKDAFS